jgi:hypothetical protein
MQQTPFGETSMRTQNKTKQQNQQTSNKLTRDFGGKRFGESSLWRCSHQIKQLLSIAQFHHKKHVRVARNDLCNKDYTEPSVVSLFGPYQSNCLEEHECETTTPNHQNTSYKRFCICDD